MAILPFCRRISSVGFDFRRCKKQNPRPKPGVLVGGGGAAGVSWKTDQTPPGISSTKLFCATSIPVEVSALSLLELPTRAMTMSLAALKSPSPSTSMKIHVREYSVPSSATAGEITKSVSTSSVSGLSPVTASFASVSMPSRTH